jgi:hypothetical protein
VKAVGKPCDSSPKQRMFVSSIDCVFIFKLAHPQIFKSL